MKNHLIPAARLSSPWRIVTLILTTAAIIPAAFAAAAQASSATTHFSHVSLKPPLGWASSLVSGWTLFTPSDLQPGQNASIGVSPGGETIRTPADEFGDLVTASQGTMTTVQSQVLKTFTDGQGLPIMQQTVVLQDANGGKLLRFYIGKMNKTRFEAMSFTATPEVAR